jgi:C1A family cysteine protease
MLLFWSLFGIVCTLSVGVNSHVSDINLQNRWSAWKTLYNRSYINSTEESYRYNNWVNNLEDITIHNAKNLSWQKGLNMFSDMSLKEFKSKMATFSPINNNICDKINNQSFHDSLRNMLSPSMGRRLLNINRKILPPAVDWRTQSSVSPVENQGMCNAAYAMASKSSIETLLKITTGVLYALSTQQIIDCSGNFSNYDCRNGTIDQTFNYIIHNGLCMASDYSWKGYQGNCSSKLCRSVANISRCADLRTGDLYTTESIMEFVLNLQPISAAIDATCLMSYVSGVISDDDCFKELNSYTSIVGYNRDTTVLGFWIAKSNFGTQFGIDGYFKILMSRNVMGIATYPSIPLMDEP